jgi:hypothetical protein
LKSIRAAESATYRSERVSDLQWPGLLYGLFALLGCAFAFVGLSSSSFWSDELYTIQVVNHHGGIAEVFRRVLADVHPPLYNFVLYGWTQLAGITETSTRLLSAACAVLAVVVFAFGVRRRLSFTAIAFACAIATTSMFWFAQSQNVRDYPLSIFMSSALLVTAIRLHQRMRVQTGFPLGSWLGLTVLGVAGSQTHPYMLLTVGVLMLFLLITAPTWSMRIALAASGLLILGLYVGLLWLMTHASGQHGVNIPWFSNKPKFLLSQLRRTVFNFISRQSLAVVVAMLLALWLRRSGTTTARADEHETRWTTALCGFVFVGVIVSGLAVSILVTPSFSYRNVLVCAPFGWFLVAALYDVAGPRIDTRIGQVLAALAVLLVGSQLVVMMRGRLLPTNEPWRASAAYVHGLPGCSDTQLPLVVLPNIYGSSLTPGVHAMVERDYFGFYLPASYQLYAYLPEGVLQHFADSVQSGNTASNACPLIAWAMHGIDDEAKALTLAEQFASTPGLTTHRIVMQEFVAYELRGLGWKPEPNGFIYLQATPQTLQSPAALAAGTDIDRRRSVGDVLLVTDVTPTQAAGAHAHTYTIQRWRNGKAIGEITVSPPPPPAGLR